MAQADNGKIKAVAQAVYDGEKGTKEIMADTGAQRNIVQLGKRWLDAFRMIGVIKENQEQ